VGLYLKALQPLNINIFITWGFPSFGNWPLQSSRASPSSSVFAGLPCILALERVLSETRLLWSGY
jgi:hypothetical protein